MRYFQPLVIIRVFGLLFDYVNIP